MYKQNQYLLYNPNLMRIPMQFHDIMVNYVEMLDQSCVEFPHSHMDYEIYYCLEGAMNLHAYNNNISLSGDTFLLITPGIIHGTIYEPNTPKKYLVFIFNFRESTSSKSISKCEQDFFGFFKSFRPINHFAVKARTETQDIIRKMEQEMQFKPYGWEIMMRTYYLEFILNLVRNLIPSVKKEAYRLHNPNLAIEITKYMHNNYYKNITLHDVSEAMHVTPRHISRLFEEYFGKDFRSTLSIYRLNYAKNYLLDTDYSVEKISELVGFSTPQTLHRLFRKNEGITISQYRSVFKNLKGHE